MDSVNLVALLSFVFVTTFTPGPNNISSSSMGVLFGYRRTVNFLLGISVGFFIVMLLSGLVSQTLYSVLPSIEQILHIVGAAYILWLAYKTFKSSYDFSDENSVALQFSDGLLLQAFNPKVWIYGLTLYSTFLTAAIGNVALLFSSALFFAIVSFASISTWAVSGAAIKGILRDVRWQRVINTVLALILVYTAIELSGLLG